MSGITRLSLVLLVAAGSLVAQDVRYNFDKSADFTKFKTYKWVPIKGAQTANALVEKQIQTSIDSQLASKGLSQVDSDQADLFIGYQTAIGQDKQFTSYSTDWGYGGGWYRGGWYGGMGGSSMTTGPNVDDIYGPTRARYVRLHKSQFDLARSSKQDA